ncbi:MAG: S9 family peptidase [Bryobacteraceae bacterium]
MNGLQRLVAAAICLGPLWAEKKPVTLEVAASMRPPDLVQATWAPDGARFLYTEARKLKVHECSRLESRVLVSLAALESKAKSAKGAGAFQWQNRRVERARPQWSGDGKSVLMAAAGDLFLVDVATGDFRQLTATPEPEEEAQLSPDGAQVGYRSNNDLYVLAVDGGKIRRLTQDGSATIWNGRLDWVYPEELQISRAWWWSPDSREIAYLQFDVSPEMIHPHVDAGPVQPLAEPQRFPKAGTPNANVRLGVAAVRGGRTRWMDVGPTVDKLIARVQWMPGGKEIAVQRLSRVQDHLELLAFNASTGRARLLLEERDAAWVNLHNILHFFADGRFLWASERDGFRHLYLYGTGEPKQLTHGEWEVVEVNGVDTQRGHVWATTTKDSSLERQLYRVDLASGEMEKRTAEAGSHTVSMSPNAAYYLDSWQSHKSPPRQTLIDNAGKELAVLKETPVDYELLPVENLTFRGKDGTLFHGQTIKPKSFDPARRYPAIVMVYGGPHTQTVRDSWAGPNWEQALAQRGYVIWRMDNRGSNYRGHAFEKVVHRQFGKLELADQLEGLDYLLKQGFVDAQRVGIYGWSYGGYMTLYALTHTGKTFTAGVAGAPVTDWRHYDTIYTERYMGLPARNEDGYKASSPVHAAAQLEGKLMLVHNFQDDNVLFRNSQHMMEALQRAGKQFEMMFYPLKSHGVTGPLRLHMLQTITGFFDRNLGDKGR